MTIVRLIADDLTGALDTVAPLGFGAIERGIGVFEQRGKCLLGMQTH